LVQSKNDFPEFKKFEIKYGCDGVEERNNFLHMNFSRLEMDFELKFCKSRSDLCFRKLIKIARNGLKSRNFHGRIKSNLEHFSCW
jgi:hypothetical protein